MLGLAVAFWANVAFGQYPIPPAAVWQAFLAPDPASVEQILVRTTRLPRAVIALLVGAALALSGVLMQTLTRNPLASPGIFGVNAGAVFAIVLATTFFTLQSQQQLVWLAFTGAAMAGGLVFALGSTRRDGLSPLRVVLAGVAITAFFTAFTQGMLVLGQEGLDSMLYWIAGSVANRPLEMVMPVLPYLGIAALVALLLAPHLDILLSGEEVARGLGQNVAALKVIICVTVVCLAGSAVAMAGNIGFVGLIVPHMVRVVTGNRHRWLLTLSALWGAILLLLADLLGRFLIAPQELPIGVVTALLGTPVFIQLARKGARHGG